MNLQRRHTTRWLLIVAAVGGRAGRAGRPITGGGDEPRHALLPVARRFVG